MMELKLKIIKMGVFSIMRVKSLARCNGFAHSIIFFIFLVSTFFGCEKIKEKEVLSERPNILLVSVDTLRADHLMCYGYGFETSPFIDRLSKRGTLFKNAVTVVPSTLPSHTSLLTSLIPRKHGIVRNGFILMENLLTLQKVLRAEGYNTAAFISSYVLSSDFNFDEGFDLFDERLDKKTNLAQSKIVRDADKTTDAVIEYLKGFPEKKPFFLFIHYFDPHWPYSPPQEYLKMFDSKYSGIFSGSLKEIEEMRSGISKGEIRNAEDEKHMEALYDGEIRFMDDQFKRVISELEFEGKLQNTIVVFTADHGENFFEHDGYIDHPSRVYETNIHIPLLFFYPEAISQDRKINELVRNIDIAPTILDIAGIAIPEGFGGRSLAPLLKMNKEDKASNGPLYAFSEATRTALYPEDGAGEYLSISEKKWPNDPFSKCIRGEKWKYIGTPYLGREEFYDIGNDPGETDNLILSGDDEVKSEIVKFKEMLNSYIKAESSAGVKTENKKSIDNLKSLGYIN